VKKKVYYWSPYLSQIATPKAVINSAESINRYNKKFESIIINFFGEFNEFVNLNYKSNLKFLNYYKFNFLKFLPSKGKILSRISFLIIFLMGFFPLKKLLRIDKPDYLIIHLITSLPLILIIFFNFQTKFILRISGYPKMNYFRKLLWKIAFKKITIITCPTLNTMNYLKNLNLTDSSKFKLLYDPIINVHEINKQKKQNIDYENYFLAVGRLTKQKNFIFLCKVFKEIVKEDSSVKLLIAGTGEQKNLIRKYINKNKLSKNIILLGYKKNIFPFFKNANGFILTSLWEDPGFVLMEASFCRTLVLTADTWPGPVELIKNNVNGFIYKSNDMQSFLENFNKINNKNKNFKYIKLNNMRICKNFTIFNHYKQLCEVII